MVTMRQGAALHCSFQQMKPQERIIMLSWCCNSVYYVQPFPSTWFDGMLFQEDASQRFDNSHHRLKSPASKISQMIPFLVEMHAQKHTYIHIYIILKWWKKRSLTLPILTYKILIEVYTIVNLLIPLYLSLYTHFPYGNLLLPLLFFTLKERRRPLGSRWLVVKNKGGGSRN